MIGIVLLGVGVSIGLWLLSIPNVSSPSTYDYYEKHYKAGSFDCSDRAKVVFRAAKLEGKNPTLEYGCREKDGGCHAWVKDKNDKILCGGSQGFINSYKYNRWTWTSVEKACEQGFR